MSNAVATTGILIKRALFATPMVLTTIAEITDVGPGGKSRNKIETSTHNDGSESHILGILRQKDPTFKINYLGGDATHIAINDDIDNNVKNFWHVLFPSGRYRQGYGFVQNFELDDAPVDGKQGATITLTWASVVTEGNV
jgi:hypothetical protein